MPMKYRQLDNAAKAKGVKKSGMQASKYPPKKKVAGAAKPAKMKKGY